DAAPPDRLHTRGRWQGWAGRGLGLARRLLPRAARDSDSPTRAADGATSPGAFDAPATVRGARRAGGGAAGARCPLVRSAGERPVAMDADAAHRPLDRPLAPSSRH